MLRRLFRAVGTNSLSSLDPDTELWDYYWFFFRELWNVCWGEWARRVRNEEISLKFRVWRLYKLLIFLIRNSEANNFKSHRKFLFHTYKSIKVYLGYVRLQSQPDSLKHCQSSRSDWFDRWWFFHVIELLFQIQWK